MTLRSVFFVGRRYSFDFLVGIGEVASEETHDMHNTRFSDLASVFCEVFPLNVRASDYLIGWKVYAFRKGLRGLLGCDAQNSL